MGFKIVSRYQRIKCVYFKTLNDALIFWITTKLTLKHKDNNRKYQHQCQSATNQTKELR